MLDQDDEAALAVLRPGMVSIEERRSKTANDESDMENASDENT